MLSFEFGALKSIANIANSDVSDNGLGNIKNVSAPRYLIFSDFNEEFIDYFLKCIDYEVLRHQLNKFHVKSPNSFSRRRNVLKVGWCNLLMMLFFLYL
jgi:hypothetical protein